MIKLTSRVAAVVLAGSALTLAAGVVPAQAATTGWRTDATFAVRGKVSLLTSVAASSASDAWVAGFSLKLKGTSLPQPVMRHWTGKTWRPVTLPAKIAKAWASQIPVVTQIGASSARSVWFFNVLDGYLRLDGSRWSIGQLPGVSAKSGADVVVDTAKVFSGTDVWVFGERISTSGSNVVSAAYSAHYNGRKWSMVTVPGTGLITAVAAVSANDIFAVESNQIGSNPLASVTSNSVVARSAVAASPSARLAVARLREAASAAAPPVVLQWTPSAGWHNAPQQPSHLAASDQLVSGVAEPNGDVWFGGSASNSARGTSPLADKWNGTSWSTSDLPGKASSAHWQLAEMAPDGTGGFWALAVNSKIGAERIWHRHGSTWSQARPAFGRHHPWVLDALALVPHTHSVWGVGVEASSRKSNPSELIAVDGPLPR